MDADNASGKTHTNTRTTTSRKHAEKSTANAKISLLSGESVFIDKFFLPRT